MKLALIDNRYLDLFDSVYDLVDSMTFSLRQISQPMWHVFELTYKLFKTDAIDFLEGSSFILPNTIFFAHLANRNATVARQLHFLWARCD